MKRFDDISESRLGIIAFYTKRLSWSTMFAAGASVGIFVMFIILLAGGISTTTVMARMDSGMLEMNQMLRQTNEGAAQFIKQLRGKFPADQPEATARQALGIVESVHKIAVKAESIVNNINPEEASQLMQRVNVVLSAATPEDVNKMKTHVLGVVEHANRILSSVPPEKIDQIVNSLASLDAAKINHLIETIGKLHLQIQI